MIQVLLQTALNLFITLNNALSHTSLVSVNFFMILLISIFINVQVVRLFNLETTSLTNHHSKQSEAIFVNWNECRNRMINQMKCKYIQKIINFT